MGIGESHLIATLSAMPWCMHPVMFKTFEEVLNNKYIMNMNTTQLKEQQMESNPPVVKTGSFVNEKQIIPIQGTLIKKAYCAEMMSTPRTLENVQTDLRNAYNNSDVETIILDIESPGGSVPGVSETANLIREVSKKKDVIALGGGYLTSGAYWLASAASEIYVSDSTMVGSIGVIQAHVSVADKLKREGLKVTLIKAGEHKGAGHPAFDLSKEDLANIQARVDDLYKVFVENVANYRNVSVEKVYKEWAEARVFTGKDAVDNGMVDGIATLDEILSKI